MTNPMRGKISEERIFDAIREGTHAAIWGLIRSGTDAPYADCADFYAAIKDGVREGIEKAMPSSSEIAAAISKGVSDAMPFSDAIETAIYAGVKDK